MSKRIGGRTKLLLQDFAVVVVLVVALAGVQAIPRVDTPAALTSAESSAQAFADAAVGAFAESEAGSDPLLTAEQRSAGLPLRPVDGLSTNTPAGTIQVVLPGGLDEAVKTKTGQVVYPASDAGFDLMAENTADGARTVARINGPNGVRAVTMFVRTPADTVMLAHTNGYLTINRATPSAETVGVVSPSEARDANGDIVHSAYVVRQYAPGLYQLSEVIAPTDKTAWPVYVDPPISVPQISFSSLTDAMGSVVSAVGDAAQTVASATVSATTATVNFVKANPLESAMLVGGVALSLTGVGGPAGAAMIAGAAVNVSAEVVSVVAAHNPTNAFLGEVSTALDVTTMFTPQGAAKKVVKEGVEFAVEQTGKHVDDVVDVAKATPTPPAQLSQQISETPKIPNAPPGPAADTPAKAPPFSQSLKDSVYSEARAADPSQNLTCGYCGSRTYVQEGRTARGDVIPPNRAQMDHYMPRAHGGQSTRDNAVPSCMSCNGQKGDMLPDRFEAKKQDIIDSSRLRIADYAGQHRAPPNGVWKTPNDRPTSADQQSRPTSPAQQRAIQAHTAESVAHRQRDSARDSAREANQSGNSQRGSDNSGSKPGGQRSQKKSEKKKQSSSHKKRKRKNGTN